MDLLNAKLIYKYYIITCKNVDLMAIMDDHAGRKYACGWEMGNNEFSWNGLDNDESGPCFPPTPYL